MASLWVIMAMAEKASFDDEVPVIEAIQAGDRYAFSELVRRHEGWQDHHRRAIGQPG